MQSKAQKKTFELELVHASNWHKVCIHSNQSVILIESLVGLGFVLSSGDMIDIKAMCCLVQFTTY